MTAYSIYTDGSFSNISRVGGWGFIIACPGDYKIEDHHESGHAFATTNNRMELTAIIQGLARVITLSATDITIYTDSTYCVNAARRGKTGSAHDPNADLLSNFWTLRKAMPYVRYQWVKAHVKPFHRGGRVNRMYTIHSDYNGRVDNLANAARVLGESKQALV